MDKSGVYLLDTVWIKVNVIWTGLDFKDVIYGQWVFVSSV
jgi:hypothetical protein